MLKSPENYKNISALGLDTLVSGGTVACVETFNCDADPRTGMQSKNLNELRYEIYDKRLCNLENLPPTRDTLVQHIKRANYQCLIWKSSLEGTPNISEPNGHGWSINYLTLKPTLMTSECAPKDLLVVVSCNSPNPSAKVDVSVQKKCCHAQKHAFAVQVMSARILIKRKLLRNLMLAHLMRKMKVHRMKNRLCLVEFLNTILVFNGHSAFQLFWTYQFVSN